MSLAVRPAPRPGRRGPSAHILRHSARSRTSDPSTGEALLSLDESDPDAQTAYLAAEGHVDELTRELGEVTARYERLLMAAGPARPVAWAANTWHAPRVLRIRSIGDGARVLRGLQRNWCLYAHAHHRRARLIAEQLPHVSAKPLRFPDPAPRAALGSFTLLDANTLLASPLCSSAFPNGEVAFVEDRVTPPSRAYLKLWEALTILGELPAEGQTCLDLGSSPGGWTWVAQALGARVISVDRAALAPAIAALPRVEFRRESAFAIEPRSLPPIDWLLCDVACYPERLLHLLQRWIGSGRCRRVIATVKLQGRWEPGQTDGLRAFPGSHLVHLFHNKHELTFLWCAR
jgi:23S rRNA (cytidine2498-2'-O)-methyltransferase